jgi:hypothetical protein
MFSGTSSRKLARSEAWAEVAARCVGGGAGTPRLTQDRLATEDGRPGPAAISSDRCFDGGDLGTQLGEELLRVAELRREGA